MKRKPPPRPARKDQRMLQRVAGLPAVAALFATRPQQVERLFFDERMKGAVGSFCAALAQARKPYRLVGEDELARVAGSVMHGGVVAVAEPRPVLPLDPAEAAGWARDGVALLLLDGVGNPHNLGAIARSAAFFGVKRLVLSDHPAQAAPSDASYRVAEGGLEHLTVYRATNFASALRRLAQSYRVLGTALERGTDLAALAPAPRPTALVLGNEETGLPQATLRACDEIVTIAGTGPVQSLNVSVSAGILLHALLRRGEAPTGGPSRVL
ncbi:MAG TPA: RNA methyltransferase [Stellaceae bacterium]|nr:RNA methyltransferase [Stellaceae bacterium]